MIKPSLFRLQNYKLFFTCKEKSFHLSFFRHWHSPAAAASSGNTGRGTGAHLHFTLTDPDGAKIDPQTMFNFKA